MGSLGYFAIERNEQLDNNNWAGKDARRFKRIAMATVAVGSVALMTACSGPQSSTSVGVEEAAGHIEVAIGYNNNSSWDPLNTGSAFAMSAQNHIYEGLWDSSPVDRTPFAALASALPEDTSALEWTVDLREGAAFSDGEPVTADDVVFSVNRVLNPDKPVITSAFFNSWLDSAEKIDEDSVKLTLKYGFPYALDRFSILKIMPAHVFEGQADEFYADPANAVGSGPFKISGTEPTSFTAFETNENYTGPLAPKVSSMQWNVSVDAAARTSLLTSGVSGVPISDNIPQDAIDTLKGAGLTVEAADSMNMLGLAFNTAKAPFDNKYVRQALRMAIDSQKLIDVSIAGQGTPSSSFLQESSPYYTKAATQFDYNPEKAKKMLADAGVTDLKLTLLSTNISWTAAAVNAIKQDWDAVGVDTTLDVVETATFNSRVAAGDAADVLTFSGNPNQFGTDADLNVRWFYSTTNTFMLWNKWAETPEYGALNELLTDAEQADSAEVTDAKMNDALDVIAEEAVIYPVMHMKLFTAWDPKKVEGLKALNIPGVYMMDAKLVD
ncbi:peptide/nickel transport system substrate-binding protein [Microterricola viridarii]|uniref:Peptide/nickel transport system substrate-binding protein n=1 Tax=Microterricola viridarii TaxID=412690 RepID=A0A1H1TIY6_9MICO|nr:peptide/nickel transport system substrate-binding protein [Microterricola viridarii]